MKRFAVAIVIALVSLSCAPQAASPPANAEVPVAAPAMAKPISFKEAVAIFDCRKLKTFPGAYRDSSSPIQSSSSVTVTERIDLPGVVEHYRSQLFADGWTSVPFEGSDEISDVGVQMVFAKQGLRAEFGVGITRGFPSGQDINAGVFLIGNIEPSSLPLPEGARTTMSNPTVVAYETTTPLKDLRAFYTKTMKELGWIEYRLPAPGGVTIPWEQVEKQQDFLSGAVAIHISYQPQPATADAAKDAAAPRKALMRVVVRPSLVPVDADIPADAEDPDFQADPLAMIFALRKPLEEATAAYDQMLTKRGYHGAPAEIQEKGNDHALDYSAEGLPTLHVEYKWSKPVTFVSVKANAGE